MWAPKGSRPVAVNPRTGESCAILAPTVNTDYMNRHLEAIGRQVGSTRHVVLVLDNADWHMAKALVVPNNITLLYLPPYSPELNPIERVWAYLKSHYLSNRVFINYDDMMGNCTDAWNQLAEQCLASLTRTAWIKHVIQG